MKKFSKILLKILPYFLIVVMFFVGIFVGNGLLDKDVRATKDLIEKYKKYYYFEEGNIIDIISSSLLDEYSSYISKEEYQKIQQGAKGYTDGIGIRIEKTSKKIVMVLGNSPCDIAGVKEGGIVKKIVIDGVDYQNDTDVLKTASIGAEVEITIDYNGINQNYTIVKSNYKQTFVKYYDDSGEYSFRGNGGINFVQTSQNSYIESSKIGYIKYTSFSGKENGLEGSVGQFAHALERFKQTNKTRLILDLQDNGGGYVETLEKIASMVVPTTNGTTPVIAVSTYKDGKTENFKSKSITFENYGIQEMVILANSNSASASEVLIGAILDYATNYSQLKLKVLISNEGRDNKSTYGKGIMQTTYLNLDGSAVKLTTAKLTLPISNKCIHSVGFTEEFDSRIKVVEESEILNFATGNF